MNKSFVSALLAASLLTAGAAAAPGTADDPLVSKSYIDEVVYPYIDSAAASEKGGLRVIELEKGESLIAGAGAEIILRGGSASVLASNKGGLCDATWGEDLGQGAGVPANHLLIVPRDDGRGLTAREHTVLMVRGEFEVE